MANALTIPSRNMVRTVHRIASTGGSPKLNT